MYVCAFSCLWFVLVVCFFRLCVHFSEYNAIRWACIYTHTHTYLYTSYLSIGLIFDIFDTIKLEMKMLSQANRRRKKIQSKHSKAAKKEIHIHSNKDVYLSTKLVSFWNFSLLCLSLRSHSFHFLFFVSLYLYKRKKRDNWQLCCCWCTVHNAYNFDPLKASSHRHLFVNVLLLVCAFAFSNQSFSQIKLDNFPYQFCTLFLSASPSVGQSASLKMFPSPHHIDELHLENETEEKRRKNFSSYTENTNTCTHARMHTRTHFVDLKVHTLISVESESNQCPKTVECHRRQRKHRRRKKNINMEHQVGFKQMD